jgi:ribosome-associated protein
MNDSTNENGTAPISKTRMKKEMKDLQIMGEQLVGLSEKQLKTLKLPPGLLTAVLDAKGMRSHGAHRRQIKFIGALIRDIDPEPIKASLAFIDRDIAEKNQAFHHLERLRDRLVGGDSASFSEILDQCPHTDRQRLRLLVRNAIKEKTSEKGVKHYRALFKYLKELYKSG